MNYFAAGTAPTRRPPVKRAAYSDRTAWLLAEIARLVYEPLPQEVSVEALIDEIEAAVAAGEDRDALSGLIANAVRHGLSDTGPIARELRRGGFELLEAFTCDGTEAILAKLGPDEHFEGMLVLAFRGTQVNVQDIAADCKANLVSAPGGGRVHAGFLGAFECVEGRIEEALRKHEGPPVYITGHSLGGALALVATRYLSSDSTGATYTYGCPRVADDAFFASIKTPVYRIVNAADTVPRVPFGFGASLVIALVRLLPVNGTRAITEFFRRHFLGYTHYGNLVFLYAPPNTADADGIPFEGLVVKQSPNIFWCVRVIAKRLLATRWRAAAADHGIREYSQKLLAHARRRSGPAPQDVRAPMPEPEGSEPAA
jgi:triacylglycerol lipase